MRPSLALALVFVSATAVAVPDGPRVLVHTGRLLDANDQPATGSQKLTFRLFPDLVAPPGETALWTESYEVQVDTNGVYSVSLGEAVDDAGTAKTTFPAGLFANGPTYLEVAVGDPPETLKPRLPVGAMPYALEAEDALALGGKPASAWQPLLAPEGPLAIDASNSLTIATAGPAQAGALSATDFQTFAAKQDALNPQAPLALDASANLSIATASASQAGALSAADYQTFAAKQDALDAHGPLALDGAGNLSIATASASQPGALAAADFATFAGKQDHLTPAAPLAIDANGRLTIDTSAFVVNGTSAQNANLNIGGSATVGALSVNGQATVDKNGEAHLEGLTLVDSSSINPSQQSGGATFEYPYVYTIKVGGDDTLFYPVAMRSASNGTVPGKFVIARAYSETGPTLPYTDSSHLAGLQAVFETMNTSWADYSYTTLGQYHWRYVRTIADAGMLPDASDGHELWVRLRGGGFIYRIYANYAVDPEQPSPGSDAYNDTVNGYHFVYPGTIAEASLPNNAFAPNDSIQRVYAY